jgi:hypothetical protein
MQPTARAGHGHGTDNHDGSIAMKTQNIIII